MILHTSTGRTQGTSTPNPVYLPHSRLLWPFIWPEAQLSKLPPVNSSERYLMYLSHEQCQLLESKLALNLKAEFIQLWILAYFHSGSSKNKSSWSSCFLACFVWVGPSHLALNGSGSFLRLKEVLSYSEPGKLHIGSTHTLWGGHKTERSVKKEGFSRVMSKSHLEKQQGQETETHFPSLR